MSLAVKDASGATVTLPTSTYDANGALVVSMAAAPLPTGAAKSTDIAAIIQALAPLATDADVLAVVAKLEAVRALLAAVLTVQGTVTANIGTLGGAALDATVSALGAKLDTLHGDVGANHADLTAILTKSEALRALLAGTLAISAATLPLPAGAATDAKLEAVRALLAGTLSTSFGASENHLGEVGGNSAIAVGTLTRQANTTAYAAGQAVQSAAAAAIPLTVARKNGGTGRLTRLRLTKSGTATANASFRVHVFKAAPATLPADAATFAPSGALDYLGAFPITMTRTFTDGAKGVGTPEVGAYITFDTVAGTNTLFALIEATAPYTPASGELFTVALEADRD